MTGAHFPIIAAVLALTACAPLGPPAALDLDNAAWAAPDFGIYERQDRMERLCNYTGDGDCR